MYYTYYIIFYINTYYVLPYPVFDAHLQGSCMNLNIGQDTRASYGSVLFYKRSEPLQDPNPPPPVYS